LASWQCGTSTACILMHLSEIACMAAGLAISNAI
jgi:hypothetical protein